jgi:pantoate kinase
MGAGIVISEGVTVTVRTADQVSIQIYQNIPGEKEVLISDDSPIIRLLLEELRVPAHVETRTPLPISAGYGLSAAAVLATVHGINILYHRGLSRAECAATAHALEVRQKTGLGDVSACQDGGWCVRSGPGTGANIIRFHSGAGIATLTLGQIKTSSILSSSGIMKRIEAAFPEKVPANPEEILMNSRRFAEDSGLISDEVRKVLTACDANGIPASMTMLGNGVFASGTEAFSLLGRFGTAYELYPATHGPVILEKR